MFREEAEVEPASNFQPPIPADIPIELRGLSVKQAALQPFVNSLFPGFSAQLQQNVINMNFDCTR